MDQAEREQYIKDLEALVENRTQALKHAVGQYEGVLQVVGEIRKLLATLPGNP